MDKILAVASVIEPVLLVALGLLALVAVPLLLRALRMHLSEAQQRFAYDVAKGLADALDLIKDATPTKIDDAIAAIARDVEQQLGRSLSAAEKTAVARAVAKAGKV
jgi:Flp pilus assembly protein TadB